MMKVSWLLSLVGNTPRRTARRRLFSTESVTEILEVRIVPAALRIFHIDNTAPANGNGTAERPLNFLPAFVPNADVIFVHRGDGSARGLQNTITLGNNQQLLGDGVRHFANTADGVVQLPGNATGAFPILAGNAVVLANNNVVDGFRLADAPSASIQGSNITGFTLANLHLFNEQVVGILLTNVKGTGSITNSTITTVGNDGVKITNSSVTPLNITITNLRTSGGRTGVNLTASNATIQAVVQRSIFQNALEDGLRMSSLTVSASVSVNAVDDLFNNNSRRGIDVTGNAGSLTLVAQGSQFVNNRSDGVRASLSNGSTFTSNFLTSTVSDNRGEGVLVAGTGRVNMSATRSTFARNLNSGVFNVLTNGQGVFNFDQNRFDTNARNGFGVRTQGNQFVPGTPTSLTFTRTTFISNSDGLLIDRRDNTQVSAVIGNGPGQSAMGNTFRNNSRGLSTQAVGSTLTNALLIDDNWFIQNGDGAFYSLSGDAAVVTTHHRNRYVDSSNDAVFVRTLQNSAFGLVGSASTFGSETYTNSSFAGLEFVANLPTSEASANRRSYQNVMVEGIDARTQFVGGTYGMLIQDGSNNTLAGRTLTWSVRGTDVDLQSAGQDGILYVGTGASDSHLQLGTENAGDFVTVTNAGDDGVDVRVAGGTKLIDILGNSTAGLNSATLFTNSGTITGSGTADDSRGDGITVIQQGGGATVNIFGVQSTDNAGRGLTADIRSGTGTQRYNIGDFVTGNAALTASRQNTFSNNTLQGTVVQTVAQTVEAVFNDIIDDAAGSNPASIVYPNNLIHLNVGSTNIVAASISYENNVAQFNGSVLTPVDGAVFASSTNTLMNLSVNANTFGGNQLSDVLITPLRASVSDANDTVLSTNDFDSGPPVRDRVFLDPVAHMNIAFGVFDNGGGNAPNDRRGSTGNQINVRTLGVGTSYLGSDLIGQFRTEDDTNSAGLAFRSAGRGTLGFYNVYNAGLLNGPAPGNEFIQLGVLQDIQSTFSGANVATVPGNTITLRPAGTVFPFVIS